MFLVSSCSGLCPIHWSQVLSWEWRCSWSSADRRYQQFHCLLRCDLYWMFYGIIITLSWFTNFHNNLSLTGDNRNLNFVRFGRILNWPLHLLMDLLPDMQICGLRMRREYRELAGGGGNVPDIPRYMRYPQFCASGKRPMIRDDKRWK